MSAAPLTQKDTSMEQIEQSIRDSYGLAGDRIKQAALCGFRDSEDRSAEYYGWAADAYREGRKLREGYRLAGAR